MVKVNRIKSRFVIRAIAGFVAAVSIFLTAAVLARGYPEDNASWLITDKKYNRHYVMRITMDTYTVGTAEISAPSQSWYRFPSSNTYKREFRVLLTDESIRLFRDKGIKKSKTDNDSPYIFEGEFNDDRGIITGTFLDQYGGDFVAELQGPTNARVPIYRACESKSESRRSYQCVETMGSGTRPNACKTHPKLRTYKTLSDCQVALNRVWVDQNLRRLERSSLVALYNATNGSRWKNSDGWLSNNDHCEWFGVSCKSGRVVELRLRYNGLRGVIPNDVADLTKLSRLSVRGNQLTGEFPDAIQNLRELKTLSLSRNSFYGPIPEWIGDLKELSWMSVSFNAFNGSLPSSLSKTSLEVLYASWNFFTGELPSWGGQMKILHINDNLLSGSIDAASFGVYDLRENINSLKFEGNNFSCPFPRALREYAADAGEVCVDGVLDREYTGTAEGTYATGEKKYSYSLEGGKKSGALRRWFRNGQLREESTYKQGQREGSSRVYYPSGKLKESQNFAGGKTEGLKLFFNEDGSVKDQQCFRLGKKKPISDC